VFDDFDTGDALESGIGKGKLKTVSLPYIRVGQLCSGNLDSGLIDINSRQARMRVVLPALTEERSDIAPHIQ
jgi:hypothetical protein